ncbi:PQQ-binding-like beta-propeller repeat protein [Pelomonas aquatica]|uniref:outer membrane protein assembly factor BamB family protein n=1 Tax=Pelomonas aquatica TaxID=431058 RepID=UPI002279F7BE|nr:PQQ-binding-like beta-propeller repeat protein [Pelomonas aquatica]MCY4757129.1 PQQ-binding-like beta-propeller repeat protein [Pelomonas aquatica]
MTNNDFTLLMRISPREAEETDMTRATTQARMQAGRKIAVRVTHASRLLVVAIGAMATALAPAAPNQDWPLLGRNADMQHNSPLQLINDKNVGQLGLAWVAEMPIKDGLAGNALVVDGVIYQGAPRTQVFANDLKTGKLLWKFEAPVKMTDGPSVPRWAYNINRGIAVSGDHVFYASADCKLYAINRKTGERVWAVEACDSSQETGFYAMTMAPRVGGGKVFVGNTCGDTGVGRGHVDAFDEKTGKPLWRFYTVPDDPANGKQKTPELERAVKTWGKDWHSKTNGCGSVWDGMTYDAKLNQLYIGVDGPGPWVPTMRGKGHGDELYTNSVVALDASTGKYIWHYKQTPNDGWNYSPNAPLMLTELPVGGKSRRVVMTAPKNGFFYVLDAKTGKFLSANNLVPVNWASGIDPKTGRPIFKADARYWEHKDGKAVILPSTSGAHNWHAMAYNEQTGLVYLGAAVVPSLAELKPDMIGGLSTHDYFGYEPGNEKYRPYGELIAWDPVAQKARWRVKREIPYSGGTLTTAGNLVFQGTGDGKFEAFAADTGKLLWSFDTGGGRHGGADDRHAGRRADRPHAGRQRWFDIHRPGPDAHCLDPANACVPVPSAGVQARCDRDARQGCASHAPATPTPAAGEQGTDPRRGDPVGGQGLRVLPWSRGHQLQRQHQGLAVRLGRNTRAVRRHRHRRAAQGPGHADVPGHHDG